MKAQRDVVAETCKCCGSNIDKDEYTLTMTPAEVALLTEWIQNKAGGYGPVRELLDDVFSAFKHGESPPTVLEREAAKDILWNGDFQHPVVFVGRWKEPPND